MKKLNTKQMEKISGGDITGYVVCRGVFLGLGILSGQWWISFAGALLCPTSDLG